MQRFLIMSLLALLATTGVCFARGTTRHASSHRTTASNVHRHHATSKTHGVKRAHHSRKHHTTRAAGRHHASGHHVKTATHL